MGQRRSLGNPLFEEGSKAKTWIWGNNLKKCNLKQKLGTEDIYLGINGSNPLSYKC